MITLTEWMSMMSDFQRYVAKRKASDPAFAAGYDSGYLDFRIGVLLRQQCG